MYTTPIQAITDFLLRPTDNQIYRGKRLLMSQIEAIPFNLLLLKLAGNRIFKITFSSKTIDLIIKLNPFKTRYFSSDRYVALFSDFKSELILNSVDLRKEIGEKYDFTSNTLTLKNFVRTALPFTAAGLILEILSLVSSGGFSRARSFDSLISSFNFYCSRSLFN